jgi:hypothetical protein
MRSTVAKRTTRKNDGEETDLAEAIRRRFAPYGGVDLEPHPRTPARPPPDFSEDPEEGA